MTRIKAEPRWVTSSLPAGLGGGGRIPQTLQGWETNPPRSPPSQPSPATRLCCLSLSPQGPPAPPLSPRSPRPLPLARLLPQPRSGQQQTATIDLPVQQNPAWGERGPRRRDTCDGSAVSTSGA